LVYFFGFRNELKIIWQMNLQGSKQINNENMVVRMQCAITGMSLYEKYSWVWFLW
jgi:hypothetical protein